MNQVNQLLEARSRRFGERPLRIALSLSAVLHIGAVVAVLLVPGLLRSEPPRIEYVEIVSISAADIAPGPKPVPKKKPPPPPKEQEPEAIPEEPVDIPDDIPVLEPEKEEPKPAPPKEPEPVVVPEEPAQTDDPVEDPAPEVPEENYLPSASKGEVKDTSVAGFDDPDFRYTYYTDSLIRAIQRTWRRPRINRKLDLAISFRVARDGTVSDIAVARTAGIPSYDRAGIRALQSATIPPLPVAYRKASLGVTLLLP